MLRVFFGDLDLRSSDNPGERLPYSGAGLSEEFLYFDALRMGNFDRMNRIYRMQKRWE